MAKKNSPNKNTGPGGGRDKKKSQNTKPEPVIGTAYRAPGMPAALPPNASIAPPPSGLAALGDDSGLYETASEDLVKFLKQNQPQTYFGTVLRDAGQISSGTGPALYESWLQNQFYANQFSDYNAARYGNPELLFEEWVAGQGGAEGLAEKARNQYNAMTAYQRGQQYNPFSAGQGRWSMWN